MSDEPPPPSYAALDEKFTRLLQGRDRHDAVAGRQKDDPPPPPYEAVFKPIEDGVDESSTPMLQGKDGAGAVGGQQTEDNELNREERKKQHEQKIKKLMADLRRECSVEEASPEEIEMLDVGGDSVLPESDVSSLQSSFRGRDEQLHRQHEPARVSLADESDGQQQQQQQGIELACLADQADGVDEADASVQRLSQQHSTMESQEITAEPGPENNDVDHPIDEASMEDGTDRRKKLGVMAMLAGSPTRKLIVAGSILFCLGLLLLVILLPKSFVYVNYYEYAMSRNSVTGAVDYSTVYDSGCYLLAPQDELVRFDATAHFLDQSLVIMDNTGLSIQLDISLQYFLKRDEIPELFQRYHYGYDEVLRSLIESQVKNLAIGFSLDQYRLHRQEVEAAILKRIQYALSGDCCDDCCPEKCGRRKVECAVPACRPRESCYRGHHVTVKFFQLGAISIPEEVFERLMKRIILQVEGDTEYYFQQKAIEVKKTEQIAQRIRNQAEEVKKEARAQERVIRAKAEAEKNLEVERARQLALKQVFSQFNITDEDNKLSYMYARALAEQGDNIRYTYAYNGLSVSSP